MNLPSSRALRPQNLVFTLLLTALALWPALSSADSDVDAVEIFVPIYERYIPGFKKKDLNARAEARMKLTSAQAKEIILLMEAEYDRLVKANGGKDLVGRGIQRRHANDQSGMAWANHELWLERCFNGVKPTYENLVLGQYRLSLEARIRGGGGNGVWSRISADKLMVDRRIGFRFDPLEAKATDERLAKLGLNNLVGKGLEGIEFAQSGATIFLANKGTDACVVHVSGTQPRFRRLLENNGLAKDWLGEADGMSVAFTSKHNLSIYPARFAWPGSVNLRLVESTWKGKEFKAWWLMKGSYGIDDESVSRVQAYQDEGSAWVSKHSASPSDLARLGLKSATDTFPAYLQRNTTLSRLATYIKGQNLWVTREMMPDRPERSIEAEYGAPLKLAPNAWQRSIVSTGAGARLPEQMFGSDGSGEVMRNKEASIMVGGHPSYIKSTWALNPYVGTYNVMTDWMQRSRDKTKQSRPDEFMDVTLLPPKNGIGMAQGVAEYVTQLRNRAGEVVNSTERFYTGSAIKDPRMALWVEIERLTEKQAQALLATLNAKPYPSTAVSSKPSKTQTTAQAN